MLSLFSRNEPNDSSHIPVRPKPCAPIGGFGKCWKGGGCEFGLCIGSALRVLEKVGAGTCDSGDLFGASLRAVSRDSANVGSGSVFGEPVCVLP